MRWKGVLKYNTKRACSTLLGYYILIIVYGTLLIILNNIESFNVTTSGIDTIVNIILFLLGTEIIRNSYSMSEGFNVSKKEYLKGVLIGIIFIALITTAIDIIINKLFNSFMVSPSIIHVIYGETKILTEGILIFIMHLTALSAGLFVSILYYKCKDFRFGTIIFLFILIGLAFLCGILYIRIFYIGSGGNLILNIFLDLLWTISLLGISYILLYKFKINLI